MGSRYILRFIAGLMIGIVLAGCATAGGFNRFKGRALKLDVAIYEGTPPPEYSYRSLGPVEGVRQNHLFDMEMAAAQLFTTLEVMALKAKAFGANAVIKTQAHSSFKEIRYTGEAVIFDTLPPG